MQKLNHKTCSIFEVSDVTSRLFDNPVNRC